MARSGLQVLVYDDEGVEERSFNEALASLSAELDPSAFVVDRIDAAQLIAGDWEATTAALVIPGGRDVRYDAKLRGEGNRRIRNYVFGGGCYIGFCAGAYYGSARVEFDKGYPLEVCGERELAFFPGIASGPVSGPGTFIYNSEAGGRAAALGFVDGTVGATLAYVNGGCCFEQSEQFDSVQVLANYADLDVTGAAIVLCRVGEGVALLSGAHLEYRVTSLDPNPSSDGEVLAALRSTDADRQSAFRYLLRTVGLK